ncbi:MAG: hypothetical protein AAFZ92_11635, partial [Pseudomonadota bacterium]
VANIIGLRNTLVRLRTYCLEEQDASNAKIARLIQQLGFESGTTQSRSADARKKLTVSTFPMKIYLINNQSQ